MGDVRLRVEPFDLWHYFSRRLFEPLVRLRVDLAGRLDAEALAAAVELSAATVPLVGCGFAGGDRRPRWVPRPGALHEVVRVVERTPPDDVLAASVDVERGPQLTITLVRDGDRDTLCAVVNHMLCDAADFMRYLAGLNRLYGAIVAGRVPEPEPWRPRGSRAALSGLGPVRRWHALRSRFDAYDEGTAGAPGRPEFRHGDGPAHLLTWEVPEETFTAARAAAKRRGATANDLLLAAFAHAWAVSTGTSRVTLPSTIDVRPFLAPGREPGITNLSSNALCSVDVAPGSSVLGLLPQVTAQMAVHKRGDGALRSVMMWDLAVAALPYRYLSSHFTRLLTFPAVTFTNMGVLAEPTVDFGVPVRAAHLSTAVKPSPFFQLSVSTFRGAPTLSANIAGDDDAAARSTEILSATAQGIESAALPG